MKIVYLDKDTKELAQRYDQLSDSQFAHGLRMIELLGIKPADCVLDIGCGTGKLTSYVSDITGPKGKVIGIDPLASRIEIAKKRAKANLFFEVGGSDDLYRFADQSFDCVYLNSVFHWIEKKEDTLREIKRILKKNGKLGLTTGDKDQKNPIRLIIENAIIKILGYKPQEEVFSPFSLSSQDIKRTIERSGLSITLFQINEDSFYSDSAEQILEFFLSSSFGNFLSQIPQEYKPQITEEIKKGLERLRTPKGIERKHSVVTVICKKP
ncbi:methyltransferase domain-containing protein [Methylacidiphilum caldifontis]|uniref:class I SAM-dependent methyltransferase n=1 Tax=Methylacidiphilum caldifontis TaxID=2795386 RepID=UPI001A90AAEC|nr:class I SAM-dependent methyltransferase [Methylacidiphilum caldifontis]QSR88068.1 methyltransferase domain-containing protein [Methylacidiphilum caldifontis]